MGGRHLSLLLRFGPEEEALGENKAGSTRKYAASELELAHPRNERREQFASRRRLTWPSRALVVEEPRGGFASRHLVHTFVD